MGNKKVLSRQKERFFTEKLIIITVMFVFALLIGFNTVRVYSQCIRAHFFEFSATGPGDNTSTQGTIEIAIKENKTYPMLEIIINGELFDYEFEENNQAIITVCDGDVIQVNGSMYDDNIRIEIKNMSANINNVLGNNHIILRRDINTLAVIKI